MVKAYFAPKPTMKKDPPLDKVKFWVFIRNMEKKLEKPLLSDYDRSITKSYQMKKRGSSILQLGTQSNLQALLEFYKDVLLFAKDTNLTTAQLRRVDHIPKQAGAGKWKFKLGKELVWPQLVDHLPTKMYKLHQWYMEASATGLLMLEVRIGDQYYFYGDAIINVPLEELYFLYNQDTLDKSLISS